MGIQTTILWIKLLFRKAYVCESFYSFREIYNSNTLQLEFSTTISIKHDIVLRINYITLKVFEIVFIENAAGEKPCNSDTGTRMRDSNKIF